MKRGIVVIASALAIFLAAVSHAAPQPARRIPAEPPDDLKRFACRNGYTPFRIDQEHLTFFAGVYDPKTNHKLGTLASVFYDARELGSDVFVDYPDLETEDIVPIIGYLYRVTAVGQLGVAFQWVGSHPPPGITFQHGSFAIPL
jgi:hypothetical protein